jgi:glycosyltransferase involved in cell wall biosynthesis
VAGHFMPEVGYQEVYLARAWSRLGHEVRVLTSDRVSPSATAVIAQHRYAPGLTYDKKYGFSVLRLRTAGQLGAMVVAPHLSRAVADFDPDVVLVLGVGKLFPYPLFFGERSHKLIVLFGDNSDFWDFSSPALYFQSVRSKVSQRTLKDTVYRRALKSSDRVGLTTPETKSILASSLSPRLRQLLEEKCFFSPLGYDRDEFYFSDASREAARIELGASPEDCIFITCTRVTEKKELEQVIDRVSELRSNGLKISYVIAGFLGDEYDRRLKRYIQVQPEPQIFHCYSFLDHASTRRLYCAADVGIWRKAAISIQEAMGTGLPVLLESKPSVSHLVQDGVNGWHFSPGDLGSGMVVAVHGAHVRARKDIAAYNRRTLSYETIGRRLLDSVASDVARGSHALVGDEEK